MKAIRLHEPTGSDGLVFEEVPDATPMACDVLVKVAACGITHNELDWPVWTCRAGHRRSSIIPGHVHAAAVPRAGLTAWTGLFDHGRLAEGQTVVINRTERAARSGRRRSSSPGGPAPR